MPPPSGPPSGVAHVLSQVGASAGRRFAARLAEVGLTPAHAGVLRMVGQQAGLSQRAIAAALGMAPSRVVALVDELEAQGLVERRRSPTDRRNHELHTPAGAQERLGVIRQIVRRHDAEVTSGLTKDERAQLLALLAKVAAALED